MHRIALVLIIAVLALGSAKSVEGNVVPPEPHLVQEPVMAIEAKQEHVLDDVTSGRVLAAKMALFYQLRAEKKDPAYFGDILRFIETCQIDQEGYGIIAKEFGKATVQNYCSSNNQKLTVKETLKEKWENVKHVKQQRNRVQHPNRH